MKFFFCLLLVLALWIVHFSQPTEVGVMDSVQQSLETGSAQQLATNFDANIELIIDSEAIEFPSVEATHAKFILKSFFRKYPPRHFQYVYQGTAEHQQYSTGIYQTGQEQFQVYVLLRENAGYNARYHSGVGTPVTDKPRYHISTLHFRKVT